MSELADAFKEWEVAQQEADELMKEFRGKIKEFGIDDEVVVAEFRKKVIEASWRSNDAMESAIRLSRVHRVR